MVFLRAVVLASVAGLGVAPRTASAAPLRPRVTVFLFPASGFTPRAVARVSTQLQRALHKNSQLEVRDPDKLLVEFAGEVPREAVENARDQLTRGLDRLRKDDAVGALEPLQQAVTQLEPLLVFIRKDELARAMIGLAVAQATARKTRQAKATFTQLLVWRPRAVYDTRLFDARHLPLFEQARQQAQARRRGSIELTSSPPGARAFVDGRYVGVTPTVAFGLTVGDHYATFMMPGYVKAGRKVRVAQQQQESYGVDLRRSQKYLLLQQSLRQAHAALGRARAVSAMVDLRSVLLVDQVVFATLGYAGQGRVNVQGFLYDLRSKLRLSQSSAELDVRQAEGFERLARQLYLNVRYDGTLETPPDAPPPPPTRRRPVWARWWFWTAIGAATTAAILTGVLWPRDHGCQATVGGSDRCLGVRN